MTNKMVTRKNLKESSLTSNLTPLELIEKHLNGEIIMDDDLKQYCLFFLKEDLEELEKLRDEHFTKLSATRGDILL